MPRKQAELRKNELLNIAMLQFLRQGYEKTSIRSIVGEANGEIGMFYHHFASKEEIFKAVLEQYNAEYIKKTKHMVEEGKAEPFAHLFERLFSAMNHALTEYRDMNTDRMDANMVTILHQNTLVSLHPIVCDLLSHYVIRGEMMPPPGVETGLLAKYLLFGISAVIHDPSKTSMEAKSHAIKVLSCRLLGIADPSIDGADADS